MIKTTITGITDMGCVRTNNEDTFQALTLDNDRRILAVAIDGVGGYEGGEVAAEIARDTITQVITSIPEATIVDAMMHASNAVLEQRTARPTLGQMSCVATAVLADRESRRFTFAHIGDSRLYQFNPAAEKPLVKLSHDQSLVGYQEEQGILTEYEAMHHPQRNIISRILGMEQLTPASAAEFIDSGEFPIIPESTLLLCSDGLTDMIDSQAISSILGNSDLNLEQQAQLLVDSAKAAGGRDNVTVVLVHFGPETFTIAEEETDTDTDHDTHDVVTDDNDDVIILNTDTESHMETNHDDDNNQDSHSNDSVDANDANDAVPTDEEDSSMITALAVILGLTTVGAMLAVIAMIL